MNHLIDAIRRELEQRRLVREKVQVIPGWDPNVWRWDNYGAVMKFDKYGDRNHEHGREIDHLVPAWAGGSNDTADLRPLTWRNNVSKGPALPIPALFLR